MIKYLLKNLSNKIIFIKYKVFIKLYLLNIKYLLSSYEL